jgi:hypothetical protein
MPVTEPQRVPPAKAFVDASPRQSAQQMSASRRSKDRSQDRGGAGSTRAATHARRHNDIRSRCLFPLKIRAADRRAHGRRPIRGASTDTEKFFKSDPRIDLQALVWAPESTARFVVINNRLIKEGGSIDDIVVVRINQDDVLLAEGSDRWHEVFKIR